MSTQKPTEAIAAKNAIANAICYNRPVDNHLACQADYDLASYILSSLSYDGYVVVPREPTEAKGDEMDKFFGLDNPEGRAIAAREAAKLEAEKGE